jgi:hypothetical protein
MLRRWHRAPRRRPAVEAPPHHLDLLSRLPQLTAAGERAQHLVENLVLLLDQLQQLAAVGPVVQGYVVQRAVPCANAAYISLDYWHHSLKLVVQLV